MRVLAGLMGAAKPEPAQAGAAGISECPVVGPIHGRLRAEFAARGKGVQA